MCETNCLNTVFPRLMTQDEFIIPLAFDSKTVELIRNDLPDDSTAKIKKALPSLEQSISIRLQIVIEDLK